MVGGCLNVNLVIGFGPSLGLALWPRAKPIKKIYVQNIFCSKKHISSKKNWWVIFLMQKVISIGGSLMQQRVNKGKEGGGRGSSFPFP